MIILSEKSLEHLYQETIERAAIPATSERQELRTKYLVRDLVVSLDEVINAAGETYPQIQIYADVLKIGSQAAPLQLGEVTFLIVARKLEVEGHRTIELSETSQGLVLYAQELAGSLQFTHAQDPAWTLEQMPDEGVGLEIYAEAGRVQHKTIQRIESSMLEWGRPTRLLFTTQFQLAAALFSSHPAETQALLRWIIFLTSGRSVASDLQEQSESLLTRSLLTASHATFVPYLSLEAYQREAQALFGPVKTYETQYERFQDQQASLADRQQAVRLMLQQNGAIIEAHQQLLARAQQELEQVMAHAEEAKEKCKAQQYRVEVAKIEFEYGLKVWEIEAKWNAMRRMFLAVGDFAISVATAAATGGGGSAEAIATALSALQAMKDLVGESDAIYKEMQHLLASMEKMQALSEALDALLKSLYALTQGQGSEVNFPHLLAPDLDLISGQAEWDVFLATTNVYLQQALNAPIEGAAGYQLESEKLAIYGKAFLASQATVVKAAQELWQLQVQATVSQRLQAPLQAYLDVLEEDEERYAATLQLLFQQQLNMKCWLFLALQNLVWAYQYEALTTHEPIPPISSTALQMEEALAGITRKLNAVLEQLKPPPQESRFPQYILAEVESHSAYAGVMDALREQREATITIPLNDFAFRGLDRVRVLKVRCLLQGVSIPTGRRVSLTLESSGISTDRWQDHTYQFAAAPSKRSFVYENLRADMDGIATIRDEVLEVDRAIMTDGEVADEYTNHYSRPTPFTQWRLALDDTEGIIDPSSLVSLKLIWFVSAVVTNPTR